MQVYRYPEKDSWDTILQRPESSSSTKNIDRTVRKILQNVKEKGDKALIKYARKLDGADLDSLAVTPKEIKEASSLISPELKDAIWLAAANIETFHRSQVIEKNVIETMPGVYCWRKAAPIESVGLYIPGGSAPLFSTVLMLGIPAKVARCPNVVLCTPPAKDGNIHPAILFAADLCGISTIFKTGGAQAIAAMSFGTASIPKTVKVFGPGNKYVMTAKEMVQQFGTAIDLPAGPSEVLIIADQSANPDFVAADLLSQAEHGPDSQVVLLTNNESLAEKVNLSLQAQLKKLPREKIAREALRCSKLIISKTLDECMAISNRYAPEHLILACQNSEDLAEMVVSAGSVFIGHYSPESAGDYASGTNHTLPTNGFATMYSGVSLDSFVKKITFQQLTKSGLQAIGPSVITMAASEGLDGHKNAIEVRLKEII